jgi:hypothetical protein
LNWPVTFESRLDSWNQLRTQVKHLPVDVALETINTWWFRAPWTAYHLHKYILNWDPDQVVNISLGKSKPRRQVSQEQIKQKIR